METVTAYLKSLPPETRTEIETVRVVILKNLPEGYEETMQYGIISYIVPLSRYPSGYLGMKDQPLPYAYLKARKNDNMLALMSIYVDVTRLEWFTEAYEKSGKKLKMGKSCIYFKKADDLNLDVVGKAVAKTSVTQYIKMYEGTRKK